MYISTHTCSYTPTHADTLIHSHTVQHAHIQSHIASDTLTHSDALMHSDTHMHTCMYTDTQAHLGTLRNTLLLTISHAYDTHTLTCVLIHNHSPSHTHIYDSHTEWNVTHTETLAHMLACRQTPIHSHAQHTLSHSHTKWSTHSSHMGRGRKQSAEGGFMVGPASNPMTWLGYLTNVANTGVSLGGC